MTFLALVMAGAGVVLLVVSALGLFRLQDALARQHAATKSTTLALGLILIGTALEAGSTAVWLRVCVIVVMLLATLPIASQMLARAAVRECIRPEELRDAPRVSPTRDPP